MTTEKPSVVSNIVFMIGGCVVKLSGLGAEKRVLISAAMIELKVLLRVLVESKLEGDDYLTVVGGLTTSESESDGLANQMGNPQKMIAETLTQIKEGL